MELMRQTHGDGETLVSGKSRTRRFGFCPTVIGLFQGPGFGSPNAQAGLDEVFRFREK
ncbi:MAG: hypothetical protein KJS91_05780 [Planctomycetes bacterium]|nr:hypothetical protein [Planctomycetota bacterium]